MKKFIQLTFALLLTLGLYSNSFGQWIPGPPPAGLAPIYRMYNNSTSKHHLASTIEAQNLTSYSGTPWINEGLMGWVSATGTNPIYRYYRHNIGHYFSMSSATPSGYVSEGSIGNGASGPIPLIGGGRSVYQYVRIKGGSGHFYTTNYNELGGGNSSWRYEGVAFYLFIVPGYSYTSS